MEGSAPVTNPNTTKDIDFISFVVKSIVDQPDQVEIERTVDELGVLITIRVNKEDMGKVVGREGRTAKAMRTLLRQIGSQDGNRVNLKILEPLGEDGQPQERPMDSNDDYNSDSDNDAPSPDISIDDDSIFS